MKTYKVFEKGCQRVVMKQGWSWPAFFLQWIWAFSKTLILPGVIAFAGSVVFALIPVKNIMNPYVLIAGIVLGAILPVSAFQFSACNRFTLFLPYCHMPNLSKIDGERNLYRNPKSGTEGKQVVGGSVDEERLLPLGDGSGKESGRGGFRQTVIGERRKRT